EIPVTYFHIGLNSFGFYISIGLQIFPGIWKAVGKYERIFNFGIKEKRVQGKVQVFGEISAVIDIKISAYRPFGFSFSNIYWKHIAELNSFSIFSKNGGGFISQPTTYAGGKIFSKSYK